MDTFDVPSYACDLMPISCLHTLPILGPGNQLCLDETRDPQAGLQMILRHESNGSQTLVAPKHPDINLPTVFPSNSI